MNLEEGFRRIGVAIILAAYVIKGFIQEEAEPENKG
jgi:hypothetical protein